MNGKILYMLVSATVSATIAYAEAEHITKDACKNFNVSLKSVRLINNQASSLVCNCSVSSQKQPFYINVFSKGPKHLLYISGSLYGVDKILNIDNPPDVNGWAMVFDGELDHMQIILGTRTETHGSSVMQSVAIKATSAVEVACGPLNTTTVGQTASHASHTPQETSTSTSRPTSTSSRLTTQKHWTSTVIQEITGMLGPTAHQTPTDVKETTPTITENTDRPVTLPLGAAIGGGGVILGLVVGFCLGRKLRSNRNTTGALATTTATPGRAVEQHYTSAGYTPDTRPHSQLAGAYTNSSPGDADRVVDLLDNPYHEIDEQSIGRGVSQGAEDNGSGYGFPNHDGRQRLAAARARRVNYSHMTASSVYNPRDVPGQPNDYLELIDLPSDIYENQSEGPTHRFQTDEDGYLRPTTRD